MKQEIAVIGAGTMGNGIAHVFAQQGFKVFLIDANQTQLEQAKNTISKNLDRQIKKGEILEENKIEILQNIILQNAIDENLKNVTLAIEAVSENILIKEKVLTTLNTFLTENAIIASNTSSISITKLASYVLNPDRFIGMHFMNPVPVMPLVEIISGFHTTNSTLKTIKNITLKLNKTPLLSEDYPGFVANRILMPMINEAILTLHEGVANVESIDGIMKLGMNHPMGPLQLADFIGLDVCLAILNVLYQDFKNPKYAPSVLLVNMVAAGELGVKSGRGFYDYNSGIKNATVSAKFINK